MDTGLRKQQVSFEQLNALLDFVKEHNELAKGLTRDMRGQLHTLQIWNLCAKKLNAIKDGTTKDGEGWAKYWCDWKYRVSKHALKLKAAKDSNSLPPDGVTQLSPMEEVLLSIIGDDAVDGIVNQDPQAGRATEEQRANSHHNEVADNEYCETRRGLKRRHSEDSPDMDQRSGSTSPVDRNQIDDENGGPDDIENDNDGIDFIRLKEKILEDTRALAEIAQVVDSEVTRLTRAMSNVRDVVTIINI